MNLEKYFEEYASEKIQNYQKLVVKEIASNNKNIICKARQMGMTHLVLSFLAFVFENTNKNIAIIGADSRNLEAKRKIFYSYLKDSKDLYKTKEHCMSTKSGNTVRFSAEYGPGNGLQDFIFIDEMCYSYNQETFNIEPKNHQTIILASTPTPKEKGGKFYRTWISKDESWNRIHLPLEVNENYDEEYVEKFKKICGHRSFRNEILALF